MSLDPVVVTANDVVVRTAAHIALTPAKQSLPPVELPPAPTGINSFPASSFTTQCATIALNDSPDGTMTAQTLTITGIYTPLLAATTTGSAPVKASFAVTTGTSVTQGTETSIEVSLGLTKGLFTAGAKITETYNYSVTTTQSQTFTYEFDVMPQSGQVTVVFWQLQLIFTIDSTLQKQTDPKKDGTRVTNAFTNGYNTYVSTQYPAATGMINQ